MGGGVSVEKREAMVFGVLRIEPINAPNKAQCMVGVGGSHTDVKRRWWVWRGVVGEESWRADLFAGRGVAGRIR